MSIFRAAKEKVTLVAAVTLAAVIGGAMTGVVMASVPGGGDVNACYKTIGGDVRVIDTSSESCANDETAMNLSDEVAKTNSAFVRYDGVDFEQTNRKNVVDIDFLDTDNDGNGVKDSVCIQFAFTPNTMSAVGPEGHVFQGIVEAAADPAYVDLKCGDSKYNAVMPMTMEGTVLTVTAYR